MAMADEGEVAIIADETPPPALADDGSGMRSAVKGVEQVAGDVIGFDIGAYVGRWSFERRC